MYTTTINNQAFFLKKPLLTDFFANEATQSDKRIIEYLIRMILQLKTAIPRAEYIAQSLNICKRTVFRCLAKIRELDLFEIRNRFKHGKKKSSLYKLSAWVHTTVSLSFLATYLPALRRLTSILVFNIFPVQKSFAECKLPFYSSKEMSPRIIFRFNLLNLTNEVKLRSACTHENSPKRSRMYPADKPDYVKTFTYTKKPQQQEEQSTSTRRYPVYVPELPKQRNYKEDCERVVKFLASNDPKDKDAHNFLNFLDPETRAKLIYNKFIQKPE